MTDNELNAAVAVKLGKGHIRDGWEKVCVIPNYSTSIQAAFEILDAHKGDWNLRRQNGLFHCELFIPSYQQDAWADTAQKAICLAFLKLNLTETGS